jgi:nitrogen fixation NifU-like protein
VVASAYSALVVEHFDHPRNIGHLEPAPGVIEARAGRIDQGVVFRASARVSGNRFDALRFETYGCPHCIAASSWLSERLAQATLEDLRVWSWREAERVLEVPPEKRGKLLLLEDTVRQLAERWGQAL